MSQLAGAIQVIVQRRIEGIMTAVQILMLADRLTENMGRTPVAQSRRTRLS